MRWQSNTGPLAAAAQQLMEPRSCLVWVAVWQLQRNSPCYSHSAARP